MSAGGAGPAPVPVPSRKRYSSSFSHRYTSSLGGSGGSGGGGGGSGQGSAGTGAGVVGSVGAGAGGAGSVGSDKPRSKLSSPSSFHMAGDMDVDDDHDDISHFVREIDARKPLIGREKMMMEASSSRGGYHSRSRSVDVDEAGSRWRSEGIGLGRGGLAGGGGSRAVDEPALVDDLPPLVGPRYEPRSPLGRRSSTSVTTQRASSPAAAQRQQREPRPGLLLATGTSPVLTSADEIDERLRKMNEAFLASLEGLGSTTTSAGGLGSGSSSPTTATATRRSTNTSMSSAGRTGSSSSARVMEREREFGTLGRGREYWQQRPSTGAGGAGGLGALFSGSPEASGTADDVVAEEEEISTASTSSRPLPPPREERRPSPFLGRLRDQYATGGGGDSGSSSEVAGLTGSGGSGSSSGDRLGSGRRDVTPSFGTWADGSREW
ncbi:hypothetical protein ONZ45_g11270 [Pleurotus djamor]|nr:hypothetical protein ONZ45_g11270 [Pleurotus djamor]